MTAPRIITAAERAARLQGLSIPIETAPTLKPMAQFRKKGCKTCKPIPAPVRPVSSPEHPSPGQNHSQP